jgi:hypothetical protein
MPILKFYIIAMGKARSPMTDFLKNCFFNDFCKGRKNFVPTSRYAKLLRAMWYSSELQLPAMQSIFVVEFNRISQQIRIFMQNRFSP